MGSALSFVVESALGGDISVLGGSAAAVLALLRVVYFTVRSQSLPGKLLPKGTFEVEDPANDEMLAERGRDFTRIASSKQDIWIFTDVQREARKILPLDITTGGDVTEEMVKASVAKLRSWLHNEFYRIPGAADLDLDVLVSRVVALLSVTPGFDWVMRHGVPPMLLQTKYLLMISRSGQVRVAWFAFICDKPVPGAKAGSHVAKLVSEDLNTKRQPKTRTYAVLQYTAKSTSEVDMDKIIAKQVPLILRGVDKDDWTPFVQA
eukprot:TRINITY_DN70740_c0_g1_i1.p1 TRINITY_DN70740_c0_g1~~TRINITY_DN70740_c0_g1_i1.p1  ORF type:complete len:263 (-),score=50.74 TRINITY_DN70740_c0_g1_i1:14-802(-)